MSTQQTGKPLSTRQHLRLRDRYGSWAVVTGASDGIGREAAVYLAEAGVNVVLVARRQARLDELAGELEQRFGVHTRVVAADLGAPAGVEALLASTQSLEVGLLVASAGFGTSGAFLDAPLAEELAMIDVNCRAVVALCHAFGNRFVKQRRGGLVLLSSLVAFQGVPRAANYAATKAFVQTFAEGLRHEMRGLGVDVIASAPGPVHSGFAERAAMRMGQAVSPAVVARQTLDAIGKTGTVRPGLLSKLLELSLMILPRPGRVLAMGLVMGGMTRHQLPAPPGRASVLSRDVPEAYPLPVALPPWEGVPRATFSACSPRFPGVPSADVLPSRACRAASRAGRVGHRAGRVDLAGRHDERHQLRPRRRQRPAGPLRAGPGPLGLGAHHPRGAGRRPALPRRPEPRAGRDAQEELSRRDQCL
jgi:hypothetical protein